MERWKPNKFSGFVLYRIYYGDTIVYVGRTMQPLHDRIRGHVFGNPMHRKIDIDQVSKIEYADFCTQADMYLYEVYFINKYHPKLNKDDKAHDDLTIELPPVDWRLFYTPLFEKWRNKIMDENK